MEAVVEAIPYSADGQGGGTDRESYTRLVKRLSEQSVRKHFDAYEDVPWDEPDYALDPEDARWECLVDDELKETEWFQRQPDEVRRRMGLHTIASRMKVGWQFENVLQRGLLTFAESMANRSPEFRYVHHEIIEESQHSLMFQEFVDRSGIDLPVFPLWMRLGNRPVISSAAWFPELFFLYVLSGEEPIDFVQRRMLRENVNLHPLVRRICQIHITEEARHVCFAREYLLEHVPRLGKARLNVMRYQAPLIFAGSATLMLRPLPEMIRAFEIPREVVRSAYQRNPRHRKFLADSLRKVRELCDDLDLLTPTTIRLWQGLGVYGE